MRVYLNFKPEDTGSLLSLSQSRKKDHGHGNQIGSRQKKSDWMKHSEKHKDYKKNASNHSASHARFNEGRQPEANSGEIVNRKDENLRRQDVNGTKSKRSPTRK